MKGAGNEGSQETGAKQTTSSIRVISAGDLGAWLGVVVAVTAPLYVVGLLLLTVLIMVIYRRDFVASWYFASLASNMAVFRAVIEVLRPHYESLLSVGLASLSYLFFGIVAEDTRLQREKRQSLLEEIRSLQEKSESVGVDLLNYRLPRGLVEVRELSGYNVPEDFVVVREKRKLPRVKWLRRIFLALLLLIMFLAFGLLLYFRGWSWLPDLEDALAVVFIIVVSGGAHWIAARDARLGKSIPRRILKLLGLFYSMLAVLAVATLYESRPVLFSALPLPYVEFSIDASTKIQGRLLRHSDSYWHIIVEPSGQYMAIHDSSTKAVTSPPLQVSGTATVGSVPSP